MSTETTMRCPLCVGSGTRARQNPQFNRKGEFLRANFETVRCDFCNGTGRLPKPPMTSPAAAIHAAGHCIGTPKVIGAVLPVDGPMRWWFP